MSYIYFTLNNNQDLFFRFDTEEKFTSMYSNNNHKWLRATYGDDSIENFMDWYGATPESLSYISGDIVKRHIIRMELQA